MGLRVLFLTIYVTPTTQVPYKLGDAGLTTYIRMIIPNDWVKQQYLPDNLEESL